MTTRIALVFALALSITLSATQARAGDPNPPPGPVVPTMHTLQEIWDAINASSGGQLADDRQGAPWDGRSRGFGFVTFASAPGPDVTPDGLADFIKIIDFEENLTLPPGGSEAEFPVFRFVKEIDQTTPLLKLDCANAKQLNAAFRFYDSEAPGTTPSFQITMTGVFIDSDDLAGGPAAGEQHHLELISLVFLQAVYESPEDPAAAAAVTPPPGGPIAATMHTLEEIYTATTLGVTLDDQTVGPEFIARPRLEAYLELQPLRTPDTTPDGIFGDVTRILEFSDPLSVEVMIPQGGGPIVGLPNFPGLALTKELDANSTFLRDSLTGGQLFQNAILHVYEVGSDGPREYCRIELDTVVITELVSERRAYGRVLRHVERFVLEFAIIHWTYFPEGDVPI